MKRKTEKQRKEKNQASTLENDLFEEPDRDIYLTREWILGDDELMDYCLFTTARAAIQKGDAACRELLRECNCALEEGLQEACGDDPKAMVEELLRLTEGV